MNPSLPDMSCNLDSRPSIEVRLRPTPMGALWLPALAAERAWFKRSITRDRSFRTLKSRRLAASRTYNKNIILCIYNQMLIGCKLVLELLFILNTFLFNFVFCFKIFEGYMHMCEKNHYPFFLLYIVKLFK